MKTKNNLLLLFTVGFFCAGHSNNELNYKPIYELGFRIYEKQFELSSTKYKNLFYGIYINIPDHNTDSLNTLFVNCKKVQFTHLVTTKQAGGFRPHLYIHILSFENSSSAKLFNLEFMNSKFRGFRDCKPPTKALSKSNKVYVISSNACAFKSDVERVAEEIKKQLN